MTGSDLTAPHTRSNPSRITRDDLATVVAVYKTESRKYDWLGTLGVLAGLGVGWALLVIREQLGWIDDWDPIFFLTGWAIGLAGMGAAWWYRRRVLAGLQLECAFCSTPLLSRGNRKEVATRADLVAATGICPSCAHEFISTEASPSPKLTSE